jgi:hypothetical protein
MDHPLTRRGLLGGIGAAAGAAALGATLPVTAAGATLPGAVPLQPDIDPAAIEPLVPGLAYQMVDAVDFTPRDSDSAWPRTVNNQGAALNSGGALSASLNVPVGAVIKQVTFFYIAPSGGPPVSASLTRKLLTGSYDDVVPPAALPVGSGVLSYTFTVSQLVDGTATFALFVTTEDATQIVGGMRVGYQPPPQSFVALTGVPRYDSRTGAGKLGAGEERILDVGVPAGARAAVLNLTVTETEAAGFVAVFAGNIPWPGNSSVNWSTTGQTVANAVISPVGPDAKIKVLGGVNKTHIVIDTQGYLP